MKAHVFRSVVLALIVAFGLDGSLAQVQVPPRDARPRAPQPIATGKGSITGVATMAGTGQPARKARVSLSGPELRGARSTTTDDQGRFSFTALPAGRFTLSVAKPGHLSVSYGQRRPGTQGTPIQLADGQQFHAQLQIPRGSVLTGVVIDENGEATPGTGVRALRSVMQGGRRQLQSAGSGSTDDRGIYRIYGLQPGEYVVCAIPRNTGMSNLDRVQREVEGLREMLQELASQRAGEDRTRAIQDRIRTLQAAMPEQQNETVTGYAPVCYPGTTSASEASPVTLGIGEERAGVDFALHVVPLSRVEGLVINSTGTQITNVQVTLHEATRAGTPLGTNNGTRADAEGKFRFSGVAPGMYRVMARAQVGAPIVRGRGAPPPEPPVQVWGSTDIVVDGRNLSNVTLALQPGMSISGQIHFDGSATPPADLTRMRVTVSPAEPGPAASGASARVDANGRFTIASVAPGRYRLMAGGAPGWVIESATVGGQDAIDFPFEVKPNQNVSGAAMTFTDRQTELSGVVVDGRNQPAVEYTLIIFPADSRYWAGPSRRIQTTRPATDGRYTFRNLPPGEYRIATVLDIEPGSVSDPAYLQQLESATMKITLQAGEKKTQDLRLR